MKLESLVAGQQETGRSERLGQADRDLVALGIAVSAIIMFVGIGGSLLPQVMRVWLGSGAEPNVMLVNAMLLNIALVLFGWRRYRDLHSEVRARRKAEVQALQLAETDPLTGCLNRRSIGPAIEKLVVDTALRGDAVAFIMLDIDNFKRINDLNGHAVGDTILLETAERAAALLPEHSLLARLGGDEFVCAVPFNPNRSDQIDQLCGALIESVSRQVGPAQFLREVTVSIGVARNDHDAAQDPRDVQAFLHMADTAMYQAKKDGRNRYFWFEPAMESEMRFRSELETGMRRGIPLGEFVPFYEQQIDLETGDIVGFEMLARWNSPQLGMVSPEVFIPVAEEIGLIGVLSESVISQALHDARAWDPRLTLSVNISPIQLRDPWFAQRLLKLLVTSNFPPNRLEIEITENALHENLGVVKSLIVSLKNQGITVSLDDFGTGYSSLSQLRTLPFDRIKIDRSFVMNLPGNKDSATIIQAITSLADGMGLPITAEGIESAEVLAELKTFGKFKGQGYHYGQPETASQTEGRLRQLDLLLDSSDHAVHAAVYADPASADSALRKAG